VQPTFQLKVFNALMALERRHELNKMRLFGQEKWRAQALMMLPQQTATHSQPAIVESIAT
jgi:hypothetical protein